MNFNNFFNKLNSCEMKNLKILIGLVIAFGLSLFIYSCGKDELKKETSHEIDFRSLQKEIEQKHGIQTVPDIEIESDLLMADDELCTNAYAQKCGRQDYTIHKRTITYMDCPIEVTYRLWQCKVNDQYFLSFQIIDWRPLARCSKFLKQYNDLYWGGVEGGADELINEMYRHFSNVIENTYAASLAEITTSPCNKPLVHSSFFARDCYKTCIDWTYSDEGELEFGSIIEKRCATSCCLRTRSWCYENGEVKIIEENKGGLTCIRPVAPQPCPERPGICSAACNRL
jgi:hypothetical protein